MARSRVLVTMSSGQLEMSPLASGLFREVIGHFATGVTVITAFHEDIRYGTTASAVSSVSLEPPMLLICMNEQSSTGQAVATSGRFAVNILSESQTDAAARFGRKGVDKFRGLAVGLGLGAVPLLTDALATLECRVVDQVTGGTHVVFLAEVDRATAREGAPLTYFRGKFGRLELSQHEPVPASSEVVEEALRTCRAVELGAVNSTIGIIPRERLAELRRRMLQTRPAPHADGSFDLSAHVERYVAFHEYLVSLVDSATLLEAYRRAGAPKLIARLLGALDAESGADRQAAESAFRDHARLVEAYEREDADAAIGAIRHHLEQAMVFTRRHIYPG